MLISEYLQARNISVTTGNVNTNIQTTPQKSSDIKNSPFAQTLRTELEKKNSGVEFSKHALDRIEDRNIDMTENNRLSRLNKAVEIAQQKGSDDTLVIIDSTAFIVSVKNNKVVTTLSQDDMKGNIFTNIDSTVIM